MLNTKVKKNAGFDSKSNFDGYTDIIDHGRRDHPSPHYHPATGEYPKNWEESDKSFKKSGLPLLRNFFVI